MAKETENDEDNVVNEDMKQRSYEKLSLEKEEAEEHKEAALNKLKLNEILLEQLQLQCNTIKKHLDSQDQANVEMKACHIYLRPLIRTRL